MIVDMEVMSHDLVNDTNAAAAATAVAQQRDSGSAGQEQRLIKQRVAEEALMRAVPHLTW